MEQVKTEPIPHEYGRVNMDVESFVKGSELDRLEEVEARYTNALSRLKRLFEAGSLPPLTAVAKEVRGSTVTWDTTNKEMLDNLATGLGEELYTKVVTAEKARVETPEDQEPTTEPQMIPGSRSRVFTLKAGELRRKHARDTLPELPYDGTRDRSKWFRESANQIVRELQDREDEELKKPGDDFEVIMDVIRHRAEEIIRRTLPVDDHDIRFLERVVSFSLSGLEPALKMAVRDGLETLPARRKKAMEGIAA